MRASRTMAQNLLKFAIAYAIEAARRYAGPKKISY
jgi:hypothetical protein